MAKVDGIEPPSYGFGDRRSTTKLNPRIKDQQRSIETRKPAVYVAGPVEFLLSSNEVCTQQIDDYIRNTGLSENRRWSFHHEKADHMADSYLRYCESDDPVQAALVWWDIHIPVVSSVRYSDDINITRRKSSNTLKNLEII